MQSFKRGKKLRETRIRFHQHPLAQFYSYQFKPSHHEVHDLASPIGNKNRVSALKCEWKAWEQKTSVGKEGNCSGLMVLTAAL